MVADYAFEDCGGAVFGTLQGVDDGGCVDWRASDGGMLGAGVLLGIGASGNWWQESDFVVFVQHGTGLSEFLIDGKGNAREKVFEAGRSGFAMS